MDSKTMNHIKSIYYWKTTADYLERMKNIFKEKICGVSCSAFEKIITYYREVKGQSISCKEALSKALDKKSHKEAWFTKDRNTIEDIMHFYQEVEVYPFRQPYLKRHGGFRWYVHLVDHIDIPSILEYGCGSAVLTEWLIEKFPHCRYTVADIPSVTLEFVKWKKKKYNYAYNILTIGEGKEGIPLSSNYDLIICQDVLEHTPNPLDIVSSFVEHLSPKGVLVIDFINAPSGENLEISIQQRERVKKLLKNKLIVLKAIDEPKGNDGLYVKYEV